jgi:putative transposase
MRTFYRRYLPHWQPPGAVIFVTYRLFGSLPQTILNQLTEEKQRLEQQSSHPGESKRESALRLSKCLFAITDNALDLGGHGPQWLSRNDIADLIIENIFHHRGKLFRLWAFVVMPNHVHLLLEPLAINKPLGAELDNDNFVALERITHALKSYTSKRANQILNREGVFWQAESYDHWVRDEPEFERIVQYIENNPVKAGFVDSSEKWHWSSAAFERGEDGVCINQQIPM